MLAVDLEATKQCRCCPNFFHPRSTMAVVCSPDCALKLVRLTKREAKADRVKTRARLDELRPLSYWTKQAQQAFNAWVRWRDREQPCISCGRHHAGKVNAGHFLSTGARPELRFVEVNCHLQCEPCNTHLAGNLIPYRAELIRRVGLETVEWLEGPHEPKRYRADDLKAIRDDYRSRLKALQAVERAMA